MAVRDVKDASQAKAASRVYILPYDLLGNSRNSNLGSLGAIESNPPSLRKGYKRRLREAMRILAA